MTHPQQGSTCPLCYKVYTAMPCHLRMLHLVENAEERRILLNFSKHRVNVRNMSCPLLGCKYKGTVLNRHIMDSHPEISKAEAEVHLHTVRRDKTISLLAALRASNPVPSMVSSLDLASDEEGDEVHVGAQVQEEEEPTCTNPECVSRQKSLIFKNQKIVKEIAKLRQKLKMCRRFEQAVSSSSPASTSAATSTARKASRKRTHSDYNTREEGEATFHESEEDEASTHMTESTLMKQSTTSGLFTKVIVRISPVRDRNKAVLKASKAKKWSAHRREQDM